MAEKVEKTGRQKLLERLKGRNPDLNIDDDEAVSGQISSDYDEMDRRAEERKSFNDMLSSNTYAAPIITGLATGKNADGSDFDLAEWFIDNEPEMLIDMIEGNPKTKERYTAMRDKRRADEEAEASFQAEAEKKLEAMDGELDAAIAEQGMKPDEVKDLLEWLYGEDGFIARARNFDLTKDDFIKVIRIKNYDSDVEKAGNDGYVRGKNEKIDMTKHRESKRSKLPVLPNGGGTPSAGEEEDPTVKRLREMGGVY